MRNKQRIFAHRGIWDLADDRNSLDSLTRALREGFSIETDIRDHNGDVVVAHDPVQGGHPPTLGDLIDSRGKSEGVVALNVKSDGLAKLLPQINFEHFFFDMSTPEAMSYSKYGHRFGLRVSDLEPNIQPVGIQPDWIWLDAFFDDWYLDCDFARFSHFEGVVIVSPELHGRSKFAVWEHVVSNWRTYPNLCICTDYPREFESRLAND